MIADWKRVFSKRLQLVNIMAHLFLTLVNLFYSRRYYIVVLKFFRDSTNYSCNLIFSHARL